MTDLKPVGAAIAGLLISALCAFAWAEPPRRQIAPEELKQDLNVIWTAASEGDPAFDRYRSGAELQRVFADAAARIDRPMSELEFYRVAAPAVAALANGHAQLSLSAETGAWLGAGAPLLPLGVQIMEGRIFVVRDFSQGRVANPGDEILSVNGVPAANLIAASVNALALDHMSVTPRKNSAGGWTFIYDLVRLQGFGGPYDVTFQHNGHRVARRIDGRAGSEIAADWRRDFPIDPEVAERGEASFRIENGLAVMAIPHWDFPQEGQPGLSEHFRDWFAQIAAQRLEALVIDIRNNGGGSEPVATELLSYLAAQPFRYYNCLTMNAQNFSFFRDVANADELRSEIPNYTRPASEECRQYGAFEMTEAAFSNLGIQQPREPHFGGRVYLLVNSRSFSTSAEFASVFDALHIGTIVGQETSGGYLGDSSGLEAEVRLPASGMTFNSTLIAYHMAVPRHEGVQGGVVPDVVTARSIEDTLAGRDVELEAIKALESHR